MPGSALAQRSAARLLARVRMGDPFCPLSAMLFPMPRDDRIWSCRSGHGRSNWPRSEDQRSGGTAQGAPEHYSLSAGRRPHSSGVIGRATSELKSLIRTSYAVACLKNKKHQLNNEYRQEQMLN